MKHLSDYDNIFKSDARNLWGNMKVLLVDLDWGLDTKGPQSDTTD